MGFAVGHLGNASSAMSAAHVMGLAPRLAVPFATPILSPPPLPKGGVREWEYFPFTSCVYSVNSIVLVCLSFSVACRLALRRHQFPCIQCLLTCPLPLFTHQSLMPTSRQRSRAGGWQARLLPCLAQSYTSAVLGLN